MILCGSLSCPKQTFGFWTLFRDQLTQIHFAASSFAMAVLLFVPGMISKRGSNSIMVEAALAWLQNNLEPIRLPR